MSEDPILKEEIEAMLFKENFKKYAVIKKSNKATTTLSLYELHFHNPPDALHFALKYGYCVENS